MTVINPDKKRAYLEKLKENSIKLDEFISIYKTIKSRIGKKAIEKFFMAENLLLVFCVEV